MARRFKETTSRADGRDRAVQTGRVFAPKVLYLEGAHLIGDANETLFKPAESGLLNEFLNLANGKPDTILKFAQKWGALKKETTPMPRLRFKEPVSFWREQAIRFQALHRLGVNLDLKRTGDPRDWRILKVEPPSGTGALDEARLNVMSCVGKLVNEARLQPRLYWNKSNGQWQIDFDAPSGSNLLAILVLQLMVSIAGKDGVAICSHCQSKYEPERRPSTSRRNYCQDCRDKGIPGLDSKRERRRRKREKDARPK